MEGLFTIKDDSGSMTLLDLIWRATTYTETFVVLKIIAVDSLNSIWES